MKRKKEKGAIVVEATISLAVFIFLIFTILSLINICTLQAKMAVALNSAAKEISQYSYLYFKTGLGSATAGLYEGSGEYLQLGKDTIDGVGTFINDMTDAHNDFSDGNFTGMFDNVQDGVEIGSDLINKYADAIADDPKAFIIGLGKFAGSQAFDAGKAVIGRALAKSFMKKNLVAFKGDDPDRFLKKSGVENGLDGLDFTGTVILAGQKQDEIILTVTYEVTVIKLLNIDFKFTFTQMARTKAWGSGISHKDANALKLFDTDCVAMIPREPDYSQAWPDTAAENRKKLKGGAVA